MPGLKEAEELKASLTADHIHGTHANTFTAYLVPLDQLCTANTVYCGCRECLREITAELDKPWQLYEKGKRVWAERTS